MQIMKISGKRLKKVEMFDLIREKQYGIKIDVHYK